MPGTQLQIIAPDRRTHGEAIYDLVAKVFSYHGYYRARDVSRNTYFGKSHYDWQASRIGLIGERIVTHYGVWGYDMRVGSARLRTGGIGAVATDGDFRKQGLMAQTVPAALAAMRECGYDVTILFGIDDFYHRFGYVRAWSETTSIVRVEDLPKERPSGRTRKISRQLSPALHDLYNAVYSETTGTAVRPTYATGDPWGEGISGFSWTGPDGALEGYILCRRQGSRLICSEHCGDAEQTLRVLGMLARKWHCEEVELRALPYGSALARRVRWGNCKTEIGARRCGGPMIAMLNLPSCLGKMQDELTRRLQASPLAKWRGDLAIVGAKQAAALRVRAGRVTAVPPQHTPHAVCGGAEIAQLIIGTADPLEIAAVGKMSLSGDAEQLVRVLFPDQHPVLGVLDHY